jgi:hypothetical protein
MTYRDTSWLPGPVCPRDPTKQHLIAVQVSSSSPVTITAAVDGPFESHWCEPFVGGAA